MATITGGNTLVIATVVIGVMFVILVIFALLFFDLGNFLSIASFAVTTEQKGEAEVSNVAEEEYMIDPEAARQLLGFVEYPVVKIKPVEVSLFSPQAQKDMPSFSEAQIQQRCSYISIWFNRARCVQAERACAQSINSEQEHWDCMKINDFRSGKKLSETS